MGTYAGAWFKGLRQGLGVRHSFITLSTCPQRTFYGSSSLTNLEEAHLNPESGSTMLSLASPVSVLNSIDDSISGSLDRSPDKGQSIISVGGRCVRSSWGLENKLKHSDIERNLMIPKNSTSEVGLCTNPASTPASPSSATLAVSISTSSCVSRKAMLGRALMRRLRKQHSTGDIFHSSAMTNGTGPVSGAASGSSTISSGSASGLEAVREGLGNFCASISRVAGTLTAEQNRGGSSATLPLQLPLPNIIPSEMNKFEAK
ncbi:unnamed protein product, partial [Protopolystoma xenopodis]